MISGHSHHAQASILPFQISAASVFPLFSKIYHQINHKTLFSFNNRRGGQDVVASGMHSGLEWGGCKWHGCSFRSGSPEILLIFSGEQKGTRAGKRVLLEAGYVQQLFMPFCTHVDVKGISQGRGHYPTLSQCSEMMLINSCSHHLLLKIVPILKLLKTNVVFYPQE